MEKKKKLNFSDLENYVDQWMCDLHDNETLFHNQTQGTSNLLPVVLTSKEKAEILIDRLNYLKNYQKCVDFDLNYVERCQNQIENFVCALTELNCGCYQNELVLDRTRSEMYDKCEIIFVDLKNCNEHGERLSVTISENNETKKTQPFYTLFQVINNNLSLMEKLWVRAEKLQDNLKIIERLKIQLLTNYYCSC